MTDKPFGYRQTDDGQLVPQVGYSYAPRHLWTSFEQTAFDSGAAWHAEKTKRAIETHWPTILDAVKVGYDKATLVALLQLIVGETNAKL